MHRLSTYTATDPQVTSTQHYDHATVPIDTHRAARIMRSKHTSRDRGTSSRPPHAMCRTVPSIPARVRNERARLHISTPPTAHSALENRWPIACHPPAGAHMRGRAREALAAFCCVLCSCSQAHNSPTTRPDRPARSRSIRGATPRREDPLDCRQPSGRDSRAARTGARVERARSLQRRNRKTRRIPLETS